MTGEDGAARWCPQYGLGGTGVGKESNVARVGHSAGLAKMGVGWVCVVAWGAYLGVSDCLSLGIRECCVLIMPLLLL